MQGSGGKPYVLKNVGGVYSCTCPAWRNSRSPSSAAPASTCASCAATPTEKSALGARRCRRAAAKTAKDDEDEAPPLLLAESWDNATDLTGWWMSEKLDGVRAYWDGKQFLSRLGNLFTPPTGSSRACPTSPLDGELWLDRKKFQRTVSIVRRQDKSDHWKEIRYVVFDAPKLDKASRSGSQFVRRVPRSDNGRPMPSLTSTSSAGHGPPAAELARVEALGGEGLMLRAAGLEVREPAGRRRCSRSRRSTMPRHASSGTCRAGRHKGRLGALFVELPDGTTFSVGTGFSDAQRERRRRSAASSPSAIRNCPRPACRGFPSFVGVRAEAAVSCRKRRQPPSACQKRACNRNAGSSSLRAPPVSFGKFR